MGSSSTDAAQQAAEDALRVEETLAGDRKAFEPLVEKYQKRVFALLFRYVHHEQDAADLTQRTLVTAFSRLDQLNQPRMFASWLFRIAVNLAKNHIRDQSSRSFQPLDQSDLTSSPRAESDLVHRSQRQAMRQAISFLPDKQRQSILLRIDAELSFREIGEAIGISELSARVNFHHGLKSLKGLLEKQAAKAQPSPSPNTVKT
ncbi:MAG: sigma-70 family RNA polymerase sigma factor [Bradymonadales bacterium]|nr:sigma-70 family RNA polymerase sigma factor [Bradymonadales bacterium]